MTKLKRSDKDTLKNVEKDEILKLKKLTSSPEVTEIVLMQREYLSFLSFSSYSKLLETLNKSLDSINFLSLLKPLLVLKRDIL